MPRRDTLERFGAVLGITMGEWRRAAGILRIEDDDPPPHPLPDDDIFSRFPIARLDEELRKLPVGPGQPTYGDEMRQLERLQPPARERMIRILARDFLHALRRELEREEQEAGSRVEGAT